MTGEEDIGLHHREFVEGLTKVRGYFGVGMVPDQNVAGHGEGAEKEDIELLLGRIMRKCRDRWLAHLFH